jgi:hypothetical protein
MQPYLPGCDAELSLRVTRGSLISWAYRSLAQVQPPVVSYAHRFLRNKSIRYATDLQQARRPRLQFWRTERCVQ